MSLRTFSNPVWALTISDLQCRIAWDNLSGDPTRQWWASNCLANVYVLRRLVERFSNEVQIAEARCFYGFQIMMENIRSYSHSLLVDICVKQSAERMHLFDGIETILIIKRKAAWALRWISDHKLTFSERLIAFTSVEGIFSLVFPQHSGWRNVHSCLVWLTQSTYQSWLRDYTCTTVVHLILTGDHWKLWKLRNSFSEGLFRIANLLILLKSLLDSLPVSLVGMNSNLMCQYIGFVADRLLLPLRCRQREKHVSEYSGGRFLEKLLPRSKAGWLFMYNKSPTHRWLWCIT